MRIRNWLLTGTSLAVLALVPGSAFAQQAEYDALQQAQASGDADAISNAQQALTEACIVNGYASVEECIAAITGGGQPPAAEEPAAQEPPPVEEPAPAPQEAAPPADEPAPAEQLAPAAEEPPAPAEEPAPAPEQPAAPTADEQQAKFITDLQAAVNDYQAALNLSATDYDTAKAQADAAAARISELCLANGYPDVQSCIGQDLPPLPEPPAPAAQEPAAPAEQPAAPAEQPAAPAEQPAAEQPAEVGPTDTPADADATNPQQAAIDQLGTAAELYNVGINQLQNGDPAGQSTIDAANNQFAQICAELGLDVTECLAQNGITLPPVPELAAPTEPPPPPIADLPGADEAVTPQATEVLPETTKPEEAAPVLDSSKDVTSEAAAGQAPAEPPAPTEPVAPPPADDKAAQADIAPVAVESPAKLQGEQIQASALPPVEVPQNVTIINNVTNVTNVTNTNTTINNNTTTTNNNGGQTGGKPGGNGPGTPPPGGSNYTNSGFIFQIGVNLVISNPAQDFDRIRDSDRDEVYYERLPGGRVKETIERPNGVQIVTIRDRWGNVLKRSRIMPDGREYILAYYDEDNYNDEDYFNNWRDPGNDLPPLRLNIPIRDYVLDADYAAEDDVEDFFGEPPVERVRKIYTIEDVKRSARLRDSVRRVEVGSLTFDSGAATISRSQVGALSKVANAMLKLLDKNPGEVFLIEGHTDAVGSDQSNLILSDARAATVARILTDFYDVPPENLVTQGYGERYLKVKTQAAEALNRRVVLKRITPLVTVANN